MDVASCLPNTTCSIEGAACESPAPAFVNGSPLSPHRSCLALDVQQNPPQSMPHPYMGLMNMLRSSCFLMSHIGLRLIFYHPPQVQPRHPPDACTSLSANPEDRVTTAPVPFSISHHVDPNGFAAPLCLHNTCCSLSVLPLSTPAFALSPFPSFSARLSLTNNAISRPSGNTGNGCSKSPPTSPRTRTAWRFLGVIISS